MVAAFLHKTLHVESRGDKHAHNKHSTAKSFFGFIDSTWNSICARYHIHNDRYSAHSNAEVGIRYTQENEAVLKAAHLPVTVTNLYLCHFAGSGGGPAVIAADINTPITDLLEPGAIRANRGITLDGTKHGKKFRDFTAGDLRAWAAEKMGGEMEPALPAPEIAPAEPAPKKQTAPAHTPDEGIVADAPPKKHRHRHHHRNEDATEVSDDAPVVAHHRKSKTHAEPETAPPAPKAEPQPVQVCIEPTTAPAAPAPTAQELEVAARRKNLLDHGLTHQTVDKLGTTDLMGPIYTSLLAFAGNAVATSANPPAVTTPTTPTHSRGVPCARG